MIKTAAWDYVSRQAFRACGAALLVAGTFLVGCGGVWWHDRLEPTLQRAAATRQLVLVQFRTLADPTCIEADSILFSDNDVIQAVKDFQCVRLDYVLNRELADQYGVTVVPSYVVLRPDGSVIDRRSGRIDPDAFRAFLRWASLKR